MILVVIPMSVRTAVLVFVLPAVPALPAFSASLNSRSVFRSFFAHLVCLVVAFPELSEYSIWKAEEVYN